MEIIRPAQADRPTAQQKMGFSVVKLDGGDIYTPADFSLNTLTYVLDSHVCLNMGKRGVWLSKGDFMPLPMGRRFQIESDRPATILLCQFVRIDACYTTKTSKRLQEQTTREQMVFHPAPILRSLFESINLYLTRGIGNSDLLAAKQQEMFFLLQVTLSPTDHHGMIQAFTANRHSFKSQVFAHAGKADSVQTLASRLHMDRTHFFRVFKREFNESPSHWLDHHKAEKVRRYLQTHPDTPLKTAADELGFTTISTLERFCVRQWGITASQVRESESLTD